MAKQLAAEARDTRRLRGRHHQRTDPPQCSAVQCSEWRSQHLPCSDSMHDAAQAIIYIRRIDEFHCLGLARLYACAHFSIRTSLAASSGH